MKFTKTDVIKAWGLTLALMLSQAQASAESPILEFSYLVCKYNTFSADFNFLELSNTSLKTGSVIDSYVTYSSGERGLLTPINYVPALQRVDIDVHSVVGPNALGHIVINHSAGTLRGGVSYYELLEGKLRQTAYIPCFEESTPATPID